MAWPRAEQEWGWICLPAGLVLPPVGPELPCSAVSCLCDLGRVMSLIYTAASLPIKQKITGTLPAS